MMNDELFCCVSETAVRALALTGPLSQKRGPVPKLKSPANGVFVLQVRGVLSKYSDGDGLVSMINATDLIKAATQDDSISTIVIWVDSPGGEVRGAFELAEAVASASRVKNVVGIAEDLCCSAAYLVLSQCSQIYATNSMTQVGSIGVVLILLDTSKLLNDAGIRVLRFRSGPLKGLGSDGIPLSETESAYLQSRVEQVADEFIAAVARGRRLSVNSVQKLATGETFSAKVATQNGLIDGVKTVDAIFADIATPLVTMASDALRYVALIEARSESDTTPIVGKRCLPEAARMESEEHMELMHPALAKAHKKFDALPSWQRDELTALVQKGPRKC